MGLGCYGSADTRLSNIFDIWLVKRVTRLADLAMPDFFLKKNKKTLVTLYDLYGWYPIG